MMELKKLVKFKVKYVTDNNLGKGDAQEWVQHCQKKNI